MPHELGGRLHPSYETECECCGHRIKVTNNYAPMGEFLDQSIEPVEARFGALPDRDELASAIFESGVKQTESQSKSAADSIIAEIRIARARLRVEEPQP